MDNKIKSKTAEVFDLVRVQRCLKYACNAYIIGVETEYVRTRASVISPSLENINSARLGGSRISFEFDLRACREDCLENGAKL